MQVACQIYDLQVFSPFCELSFHFLDHALWNTNIFNFDDTQLTYVFFHRVYFWSQIVLLHCKFKVMKIYTYIFLLRGSYF